MNRKEKRARAAHNYPKLAFYATQHAWRFHARHFSATRTSLEHLARVTFPRWMRITPELAAALVAAAKTDPLWWEHGLTPITWRGLNGKP